MLLRAQKLQIQLANLLQGVFQFAVVAQALEYERLLFGGKADLSGATAGIADSQNPDGMAGAFGANSAAGAVADSAVEQGAAEDLGGGGERGGEFGAGIGDPCVFHSIK